MLLVTILSSPQFPLLSDLNRGWLSEFLLTTESSLPFLVLNSSLLSPRTHAGLNLTIRVEANMTTVFTCE